MKKAKLYNRSKIAIMAKLQRLVTDQRRSLFGKAAWVAFPFAASQFVRLATSIGLAWLLAPELLGAMVLINTLRTGVELIADIGIGQSIVRDPRGLDPDFYNTAWTLQIARGLLLFVLMLALTYPIAAAYGDPDLLILLPAVAPIFLITGISSPARHILHKKMEIKTLSVFDFGVTVFVSIAHIALAWVWPTIWALILGLLVGATGSSVASYFIMDRRNLRLKLDRESVKSIFNFGKWIFLSSIIFYVGTSFDRLYFAEVFSAAFLGIYGIAKTYSETFTTLFVRISQLLVFPKVSSTKIRGDELRQQISSVRFGLLTCISMVLACLISVSDQFIFSVYDFRYMDAGIIMTILMAGAWFSILATLADSIMLGLGRSGIIAFANGLKLVVIILGLPFAIIQFGIAGALLALVVSEIVRYLAMTISLNRLKIGFIWQDAVLFVIFGALVFGFREATMMLGLTSGVSGWLVQLDTLDV